MKKKGIVKACVLLLLLSASYIFLKLPVQREKIEIKSKEDMRRLRSGHEAPRSDKRAPIKKYDGFLTRLLGWGVNKLYYNAKPEVRIVSERVKIIGGKKKAFSVIPPLIKKRIALDLYIWVDQQFEVNPPWETVKFKYQGVTNLKVCLVDRKGKEIHQETIGRAVGSDSFGVAIDVSFPEDIPLGYCITKIVITSNKDLFIEKIMLKQWNPW